MIFAGTNFPDERFTTRNPIIKESAVSAKSISLSRDLTRNNLSTKRCVMADYLLSFAATMRHPLLPPYANHQFLLFEVNKMLLLFVLFSALHLKRDFIQVYLSISFKTPPA